MLLSLSIVFIVETGIDGSCAVYACMMFMIKPNSTCLLLPSLHPLNAGRSPIKKSLCKYLVETLSLFLVECFCIATWHWLPPLTRRHWLVCGRYEKLFPAKLRETALKFPPSTSTT
jgi:hypothetical protein